ncbi:hypothetical protein RP20_CCG026986 [Aedes albopictus]|nr:hypothetical protein RP20_CCG026986 [Aedes albopictus]
MASVLTADLVAFDFVDERRSLWYHVAPHPHPTILYEDVQPPTQQEYPPAVLF